MSSALIFGCRFRAVFFAAGENYYFNARFYDPAIARFTTADTVVDGVNSTQGWNRFAYCHNNPIMYKDPTGHASEEGGGILGALRSVGEWMNNKGTALNETITQGTQSLHNTGQILRQPLDKAGQALNKNGEQVNKVLSKAADPAKRAGSYLNDNPGIALAVCTGAFFAPVALATAPEWGPGALATGKGLLGATFTKEGVATGGIGAVAQMGSYYMTSRAGGNKMTPGGFATAGTMGFLTGLGAARAGSLSAPLAKYGMSFLTGFGGDVATQAAMNMQEGKAAGENLSLSKATLSGLLNMAGARITTPSVNTKTVTSSINELPVFDRVTTGSGFGLPLGIGSDLLMSSKKKE